jgi:hypothetical protein
MAVCRMLQRFARLGLAVAVLTSCAGPESSTQAQPPRASTESSLRPSTRPDLGEPTSLPPAALLKSRSGEVRADDGAFCWATGPGSQATCNTKEFRDPATALSASPGEILTLRFVREDKPLEVVGYVQNRPDDSDPRELPIGLDNPTTVEIGLIAGTYWLDVHSKWPEGSVFHTFKLMIG